MMAYSVSNARLMSSLMELAIKMAVSDSVLHHAGEVSSTPGRMDPGGGERGYQGLAGWVRAAQWELDGQCRLRESRLTN
jgi:hypothetical protein